MQEKIFKDTSNKPINVKLDDLEAVQAKVADIIKTRDEVVKEIRNGFADCVVVFIDLVDSTKYKIENAASPEKWILRVKQFGEIIREYIEKTNGRVVKYIGDEVMGIFDKATKIDDALSLILRIKNIESNLTEITGTPTTVKIALDYGKVFLLKYEGHDELDPQGTPIDRCARIGKHCLPSTILSSFEFVSNCAFPNHWFKLGNVEMKGLGSQPIFQYGEQTIELKSKIEITEEAHKELTTAVKNLTDENQSLSLEKKTFISTIGQLQQQLKEAGEKPVIETDFSDEEDDKQQEKELEEIWSYTKQIRKLISDAGVSESDYARFIFLHLNRMDDEYNSFKDKTFDDVIEKKLVILNRDERFQLNTENKRNIKVLELIDKAQDLLTDYVNSYGDINEADLFDYTFKDADFWKKYLFISVV